MAAGEERASLAMEAGGVLSAPVFGVLGQSVLILWVSFPIISG